MLSSLLASASVLAFVPFLVGYNKRPENTQSRIARSLRLRGNQYLSRTFGAPTNNIKWTWSGWVKRSQIGATQVLVGAGNSSNTVFAQLAFNSSDQLAFVNYNSSATVERTTAAVFRDTSAWMHVVLIYDTANGTANDQCQIWVNGVRITAFGTNTNTASATSLINAAAQSQQLGIVGTVTLNTYFGGYFAENHFIDGQALDSANFGAFEAVTGAWNPKTYTGTYGANGYRLDFSDNSAATAAAIGADRSGNGNNWTPNNISVTAGTTNDSLVDTPTNYGIDTGLGGEVRGNYATINLLDAALPAGSISAGNLLISSTTTLYNVARATQAVLPGKTYFEVSNVALTAGGSFIAFGVAVPGLQGTHGSASYWGAVFDNAKGLWASGSGVTVGGSGATAAASIGRCAIDMTTGKIWVGDATNWFDSAGGTTGNPATGANPTFTVSTALILAPYVESYGASQGCYFNAGQRPFTLAAPAGFQAHCAQNLPTPAIIKPSQYFDINLRAGTGAAFTVTGKAFQPDIVWSKSRSGATDHIIYDSVRGATKQLITNSLNNETTEAQGINSFLSDGFAGQSLAALNTSGASMVDWLWKKGVLQGVDLVGYIGNGANRTVAHALGVVPAMMIVKDRSVGGTNWCVYHKNANASPASGVILLDQTNAFVAAAAVWNSTAPTSSVFSLGVNGNVNQNGDNMIAMLFAEVPGFSKFRSYIGNGSADGPFVHCDFRPRWIMIKRTDTTGSWYVEDTSRNPNNPSGLDLVANLASAEANNSPTLDILSSGFKLRSTYADFNTSGGTYIFAAFADTPFKYARAR